MNQRTHTWIAIRAVALLEDEGAEEDLVRLLRPHVRCASVGAWIPDQADAKRGGAGSATENHVLKMEPYHGWQSARFTTKREKLVDEVGTHRKVIGFLGAHPTALALLDDEWWSKAYRGDVPKPGMHLPNRAMALGTMLKDLLLMGDATVDRLLPGDIRFARYLDDDIRTDEEAAVAYLFMLSHFVADMSMPCHCDARPLASYDEGLHRELESHWSRGVGTAFERTKLLVDTSGMSPQAKTADSRAVLAAARAVDGKFDLAFANAVPGLQPDHDLWLEGMYLCRASFALASVIAPPVTYPYTDKAARAPFDTVLGDGNPELLAEVDRVVLHDAVLNTAIGWKYLWRSVSKA